MTLSTLTRLPHDDARRFDPVALRDKYPDNGPAAVAYTVAGRRLSGVVVATPSLSGDGAPTHRPIDPTSGYTANSDQAIAAYPALVLDFGPRATDRFVNTHDHGEAYPAPFVVNGREYTDLTARVRFHPVDVADIDTRYDGVTSRNAWHRMTRDRAVKHARTCGAGYVFADNVPGTDGRRVSGVFIVEVNRFDDVTDAARAVVREVGHLALLDWIDNGAEDDWYNMLTRDVRETREEARDIAERWDARVADLDDTLRAINSAALASASTPVAVVK
ncbi:hypothetical protein QLT00_gp79 [Gordonia phage Commandaria]|uniref:Uncharacterized protein n=1 Tax=Gordonia phage Commandaria TaxID=3038364 RepID=A0AAF0GIK8_9CAUD|nr:hypothetical protein QLT00_gp79 [Gordonia phage Commandaria]WGH20862.1 hypothetical protein [Gordonia phage Commandaria]